MARIDIPRIAYPHIEQNPDILSGEPIIRGTRIGVRHIAEWDRSGYSVDEIIAQYPQLTHAQVQDALSYAFDHKSEIDQLIQANTEDAVRSKYQDSAWMP